MADMPDDRHEGWNVPFAKPALAAIAVPLVLLVLILASGSWFNATFSQLTFRKPQPFPTPGLDTGISRATTDRERASPGAPEDAAVERAKAFVAENGIRGWPENGK